MASHAQRSGKVSAAELAGAADYKNEAQKQSPAHAFIKGGVGSAGRMPGYDHGSYKGPLSGGEPGAGSGGQSVEGGSIRGTGQGLPASKMGHARKYGKS